MADVSGNPPAPAITERQGTAAGASTAAPPASLSAPSPAAAAAAGTGATAATAPSTPTSAEATNREERNRALRERQNEERQRKLEELKQQAMATQKFREQQEEERRRRIEEQRQRDLERRTQVEERKKAIMEAEKERREAMLRRSEDRGMRQELKRRNEKSAIAFAFGSSTPRMLDPVDTLSSSSYWGSRRATSTTNVMTTSSHARMMNDSGSSHTSAASKRASSVFGLDHNTGDDLMTQSTSAVLPGPTQSGRRRRTDLMPTIPAQREGQTSAAASRSSSARGSVSRTPGMSMSLSRLDQLARPRQRAPLAEISALQPLHEHPRSLATSCSPSKKPKTWGPPRKSPASAGAHSMSKSMSHLATTPPKPASSVKPAAPVRSPSLHSTATGLKKSPASASTGQLSAASSGQQSQRNLWLQQPASPPRMTRAERLRLKARLVGIKRKESVGRNANGAEPNGLRSGDVTPSSPTRPLSALSQVSSASTTVATIGHHVRARTAPAGGRKPRPVSIAVTGLSVSDAARVTRSSRESVGRDRSKEMKESENAKEKDKDKDKANERRKTRPLSAPRQPRARSADMRPESSNVSSASSTASSRSKAAAPASPSSKVSPTSEQSKTPTVPIRKKTVDKAKPQTPRAKSEQPQILVVPDQTVEVKVTLDETKENEAPPLQPASQDAEDLCDKESLAERPTSLEIADTAGNILLTDSSTAPTESQQAAPETTAPEEETRSSLETTPSESCASDAQSQGQRKIISSEEEAKAALAEKRRLIREEKEREAERERLRLEEEQRLEEERRRQEELEQKLAEEEMDRLARDARKAEEERLQKAIEEARRRDEEERLRREEEARLRAEKEQQEKKAREDAERLRKEAEERLALQEKERLERKKRVDAIMSRTRGKSGPTSNSSVVVPGTIVGGNNKPTDLLLNAAATTPTELSTSQPDLLGDLVNKTLSTPNGPSETQQRTNGFHDASAVTGSNGTTTSLLPDISVIANADSVNSNTNNGNNMGDESVDLLA